MTAISGGKFWSGFAAGALSSIAASAWSGGSSMDGLGENAHAIAGTGMKGIGAGTGDLGMIAFGTVSGGAGAALTGGNFWQGAVTGLVVSGLNHYVHMIEERQDLDAFAKEKFGADYKSKYGVRNLKWGSEMNRRGIITSDGLAKYDPNSQMISVGNDQAGGFSLNGTTYISDGVASYGSEFLEVTIGHEFVHDYHNKIFNGNYNHSASEYAAYKYTINYMKDSISLKQNVQAYTNLQRNYVSGGNRYNRVSGLLP